MSIEFLQSSYTMSFQATFMLKLLNLVSQDESSDDERKKHSEVVQKIHDGEFKLNTHELAYLNRAPEYIWLEYLAFRYVFGRLANERLHTKFPLYLLIEPTSICNLRCVMCFQIDKTFGGEKSYMGRMGIELFKKTIDQAVEGGTKAITLASRGDPTLNKNLPEMLEYAKGKFLEIKLNTNGILLTEELSRSILKNEVTDLVFSIDSYEKENYEIIRKKAKFDKVVKNIKRLMEIRKKEFPNSRTNVRVSGVKVDEKQDQNKFNEFWSELVDYCALTPIQERWDTYNNSILPDDALMTCGDLFERMYVWWDGTVNPCDVDYKSTLAVGNLNEQTIEQIWNGDAYTKLRDDHMNGGRSKHKVCSQCDAYTCSNKLILSSNIIASSSLDTNLMPSGV